LLGKHSTIWATLPTLHAYCIWLGRSQGLNPLPGGENTTIYTDKVHTESLNPSVLILSVLKKSKETTDTGSRDCLQSHQELFIGNVWTLCPIYIRSYPYSPVQLPIIKCSLPRKGLRLKPVFQLYSKLRLSKDSTFRPRPCLFLSRNPVEGPVYERKYPYPTLITSFHASSELELDALNLTLRILGHIILEF
jgi:hypothetical protein